MREEVSAHIGVDRVDARRVRVGAPRGEGNQRLNDRVAIIRAIGLSLVSTVVSCSHASPAALSTELREHMKLERFDMVTSLRGLPLGVRGALQTLFGSQEFDIARDIAEPGERFQGTDAIDIPQLPLRRLIAAECSLDHCLVYYERGGSAPTYHVALFHWTPEATRLESGGLAAERLASIGDARKALLSGAIKSSTKVW